MRKLGIVLLAVVCLSLIGCAMMPLAFQSSARLAVYGNDAAVKQMNLAKAEAVKVKADCAKQIEAAKAASGLKTASMLRWLLVISILLIAGGIAATIWQAAIVGSYGLAASTVGAVSAAVSWTLLSRAGVWLGYAVAAVLLAAVIYFVIVVIKRSKVGIASVTTGVDTLLTKFVPSEEVNAAKVALNKAQQDAGTLAIVAEARGAEVKVL